MLYEATRKPPPHTLELEIRPRIVVADTNCYIDHLDLIDFILNIKCLQLVVPLLVLSELDKLAKSAGGLTDDSLEHAEYLNRKAREALKYVNGKFDTVSSEKANIKAITAQGSLLDKIRFRNEEINKPVSKKSKNKVDLKKI